MEGSLRLPDATPDVSWWTLVLHALRKVRVHSDAQGKRRALKAALFTACFPRTTGRWLRYLNRPTMRPLVQAQYRLVDKIQRPYMNVHWAPSQRADALIAHYDWLHTRFRPEGIAALFADSPLELAWLPLPQEAPAGLSLCLGYSASYEREGDLTLSLKLRVPGEPLGQLVASLAFTVVPVDGRMTLHVCCLMGCDDPENAQRFRDVTKQLHGLRPKALLLRVAQTLAQRWNAGLYGIDPHAHPFAALRYRISRRKRYAMRHMAVSYESIWQEQQARQLASGWYELPAEVHEKPLAEVPSRKRSQYRQRQALWADVLRHVQERLQGIERADAACT